MATTAAAPQAISIANWLSENEGSFLPPVCNKMLYQSGQLKLFYVGGPNQRKDFHIEEGEELFYMQRGGMTLRLLLGDRFVDQRIEQGELFLLPSNIFHSPQRAANTLGWVIERQRAADELDGLRYFCEPTLQPLWESYAHMTDLGSQVAAMIQQFKQSEQYRTGVPTAESVHPAPAPVTARQNATVPAPVLLSDWLLQHSDLLDAKSVNALPVFEGSFQFVVEVVGASDGGFEFKEENCETWLLQLEGCSLICFSDGAQRQLQQGHCLLVPVDCGFTVTQIVRARLLKAAQDPRRK